MKQMTFADAEYAGKRKQTRKELFLIEMNQMVPWKELTALIEPHHPKGEGARQPDAELVRLQRFDDGRSAVRDYDPAPVFWTGPGARIPDETTTLNFRRLLEKHEWAAGILGVINGYLGDRSLSFPGDQAPVWLYQGAVPRLGQEHRADGDAVRVVEPVDGSAFAIEDRRGASVVR